MKTKPFGNNALIEVLKNADSVSRSDENETMNYGILRRVHINIYHLTASSFGKIDENDRLHMAQELKGMVGKVVRWEQYAEGGQTFVEDGKTYALIPWWRLIGYEE